MHKIYIEQEIIDLIVKTYNPIAIYIVGSSVLGIENFKDIDILCVFNNNDYKERLRLYSNKYKVNCEIFHATESQVLSRNHRLSYAWSYLKEFRQCIYGDDILAQFDTTDILSNEIYKNDLCKKIYQDFITADQMNSTFGLNFLFKPYRMLIIYYSIINNSYTFTEDQIKTINQVHNTRQINENLYNECKMFFYNIITEICK